MTDRETEQKLDDLFDKLTPDISEQILRDLDTAEKPAQQPAQKRSLKHLWMRIGSMAAAFVLLAIGAVGYLQFARVDSTVTFDVNPSIEIRVNRLDRVLKVTPLNEDGEIVIGTMRLKNIGIDVAVNALIGSMMKNGYLSEVANSILVTVDSADETRSRALSAHISSEIEALLNAEFTGAVLSQTAVSDGSLRSLADAHAITIGKAQLIRTLIERDPLYSFDELSKLTINELNVLLGKQPELPDSIHATGSASTSAYIGTDQALAVACSYIGCSASEVDLTEAIELEYEDGRMVYDVEFRKGDSKYEFDIDAVTGNIVSFEQSHKPTGQSTEPSVSQDEPGDAVEPPITPAPAAEDIGTDRALAIALSHANVESGNAAVDQIERKRENGVIYYEIEFTDGMFEYEYKINAATGAIMKAEKERDDDGHLQETQTPETNAAYIGKAKAADIALKHAGVVSDTAQKLICKQDAEDGRAAYEVEFEADGYAYEYTIDAVTGAVLKSEKERVDEPSQETQTPGMSAAYIGKAKAADIALKHAGVGSGAAKKLICKQDTEDGRPVYEVEFEADGYAYEYTIDAVTGAILESEKERSN